MATIDKYKLDIEVTGEGKVKSLEKSISGLGSTIAGIGFGAFIANAFKMADAINDVADATGLTAGYVKGLGTAVQQAGGDMNDVGMMINKFYQNVDDLANGSDKAADAFDKIGIAGEDLLKLSRQDVLGLTLERLSELGPGAERTALGIELFGKAFGKIDPKKLEEILKTQDFAKLDAEIRKAADAYQVMEDNISALQQATITVFAQLIGKTDDLRLSAAEAEKIIKVIGLTLAAAFAVKTITNVIALTREIRALAAASALLGKNPVLRAIALGGLALGGLAAGKNLFEDQTTTTTGNKNTGADKTAAASSIEKTNREKAAIAAMKQTSELAKQFAIQNNLARITASTIGMEENRANLIKTTAQITADYEGKRSAIISAINAELDKGKQANLGIIEAKKREYAILEKQELKEKEINKITQERIQSLKTAQLELQNITKVEEFTNEYELLKGMAAAQKMIGENRKFAMDYAQREYDIAKATYPTVKEINELLLGQIQNQEKRNKLEQIYGSLILDTKLNTGKVLTDQISAEEGIKNAVELRKTALKKVEDVTGNLTNEQKKQLDQLLKTIQIETERVDVLKSLNEEMKNANNYQQGALDALDKIVNQFDPYFQAQEMVMAGWNRIGSAIDSFIETGKFKFSDFARSVIQDIAKIIAKAALLKALSATLSIFGLKIPGLAEGGPVKAGKPYLVGEKGPELFVPPGSGKIVPNEKLSGSGIGMQSAPAAVTNNYNTYNINALDAKSVAQLFAENRRALLGSVQMAQREIPYGR